MGMELERTTKIAQKLLLLHQQVATGHLVITHGKQSSLQWHLYFYLGRIVYATGGVHPVRRWYRSFKYSCPECFNTNWLIQAHSEADLWEIDLLNQAIQQGQISPSQYKAVIQNVVQEVLFVVLGQKFFTTQWFPGRQIPQQFTFLGVEQLIATTQTLREQWRDGGLGFLQELMVQFSPDLSPVLKNRALVESQTTPKAYKSILRLMRGQHTLWDVALEMQQPLPIVVRFLLPWVRRGTIDLKEIADLPSLSAHSTPMLIPVPQIAPKILVACIGELGGSQAIAQILQPLGYEVLVILNPLRGMALLQERKPKLIFLAPTMNANGYELCTFLRKTSDFQTTPIVILTKHDSMVERLRAKMAGASDFLSTPPNPTKLQQVMQKYFPITAMSVVA